MLDSKNKSPLCKFKQKVPGKTVAVGTKDLDITVPLKYLSNCWRTFGMPLTDCEINSILNWSEKYVSSNNIKATAF